MAVRVSMIAAMAEDRVIGRNNDIPWYIPEDFKHFKALTMGKPVLMGRKTFESIVTKLGKPLPGRANIVISRGGFSHDGVTVCTDLQQALDAAKIIAEDGGLDEIFVIGGAQIYEQALDLTGRLYLTIVHKKFEGDAFFPEINEHDWLLSAEEHHHGTEEQPDWSYQTLERRV